MGLELADCRRETCHVEDARWCICWAEEVGGCGCRREFEVVEASAGTGVQEKGSIGKNRVGLDSKISFNANNASAD